VRGAVPGAQFLRGEGKNLTIKANPKYVRNESGEYQCTCVCGKQFWSARFNGKYCSDHCRAMALSASRKGRRIPPVVTNTCEACGVKFVGKRPYLTYITCGAPECRLAVRRRRGQEHAGRRKAAATISRECLRCSRNFQAPHRFIRICPTCKDVQRNGQTERYASEVWGSITI
jgi:hypothetical protein